MFDLTGKGALVTGATGGIGWAIAKALHSQGAHVAISGTRAERLDQLAAELGPRVSAFPCDLRDRAAVAKLPEAAEKALGQVDILVNNAGITHDNLFMRMKDEEWDDVIAVEYRLDLGRARQSRAGELCCLEGGISWHDQVPGSRSVEPRHHRQLYRARLHQDAYDRRFDAKASRGYCRRHSGPDLRQA
jgi:NAD(P)-dependent dehydrogenase (short-subunit alcohol dehydrogenase family)